MITLVRYGELALKSAPVRKRFEDILTNNIKNGLKSAGFDYIIRKDFGRIFIEGWDQKIEHLLKRVFGIVSFSPCLKIETNITELKKEAFRLAKRFKKKETFAVRCNRVGKHDFGSQDIERLVGEEIFEKLKLKVNLTKPDQTIWIEIRDNRTYVFTEIIQAYGGLPLGTAGRVACIIKTLDDVAAAWFFMKRGCLIKPIFIGKSGKYLPILDKWYVGREIKAEHLEKLQTDHINELSKDCEAIVVGEKLFNFTENKYNLTVFRPLVGFDKKYLDGVKKVLKSAN